MSERNEIAKAKRRRDEALGVLKALTDDTIADLVRRARSRPRDGFPSVSTGVSDIHGGRDGTPVEQRVLAKAGGSEQPPTPDTWQEEPDPVGEAIAELFESLDEVVHICGVISRNRTYVEHVKDAARQDYRGLPRCANPNCDAFADVGFGGRCTADWKYRRDHDGADAPPEVIERRLARRERAS